MKLQAGPPGIPVLKSKNSPPPLYEIPENSRFPWRVPRGPRTLQKCSILMGDKSGEVRKRKLQRDILLQEVYCLGSHSFEREFFCFYWTVFPASLSITSRGVARSKNVRGVDTHGERASDEHVEREPSTGSGAESQQGPWAQPLIRGSRGLGAKPPEDENLLAFGAQLKQQFCFIQSSSKARPTPNPPPPEKKLTGFASISGTTSGKSGVDMSTRVPVSVSDGYWEWPIRQRRWAIYSRAAEC